MIGLITALTVNNWSHSNENLKYIISSQFISFIYTPKIPINPQSNRIFDAKFIESTQKQQTRIELKLDTRTDI